MIEVETLHDAIRVTIPHTEVDTGQMEQLLGWLRLASAARRSAMTETEADSMTEAAKADWWARNKTRFLPDARP